MRDGIKLHQQTGVEEYGGSLPVLLSCLSPHRRDAESSAHEYAARSYQSHGAVYHPAENSQHTLQPLLDVIHLWMKCTIQLQRRNRYIALSHGVKICAFSAVFHLASSEIGRASCRERGEV